MDEDYKSWNEAQNRTNPFWRANGISPIKRIEFEIRLSKNVHSLASAFVFFEKLEYENIQNTSNITDMIGMFFEAKSYSYSKPKGAE